MKQLIIIVNIILLSFTINAENDTCQILQISETDTVFTCEVDTCEDCIVAKVDTIIEVNEKYIKSSNTKTQKAKKIGTKTKNAQDFDSFLSDLWDAISSLWKPVWGCYEENGMSHSGPYFLFNRENDNGNFNVQIGKIREEVKITDSKSQIIYKDIIASAGTSTINNCNGVLIPNPWDGSTLCEASKRAKASAFVYLVGLDGNGKWLDKDNLGNRITNGSVANGYRDRALGYLKDVEIQGLGNLLDVASAIYGMLPSSYLTNLIVDPPQSLASR